MAKSKLSTNDIYGQILNAFKKDLESGINPFAVITQPANHSTDRAYTGFNRWHLSGVVKAKEYSCSRFATYKQIVDAGGQVRKGEKSYPVFFWGTLHIFRGNIVESANDEQHALVKAKKKNGSLTLNDIVKKTLFIKHFSVFNIDQADNIEYIATPSKLDDPINKLLKASEVNVIDGAIPLYDNSIDSIYYSQTPDDDDRKLVLKAIVQSTGHSSRLNRDFQYAEEELISTIGSSFIAESAGVEDINFDEKLIKSWLGILDEKPMFLYKASSQAQKATDLLLDKTEVISKSQSMAKAS